MRTPHRTVLSAFAALAVVASALTFVAIPSAQAVGGPTIVDSIYPGDIRQMVTTVDGTTYAVGGFQWAGASTGGMALLDTGTADVERSFPSATGAVYAIEEDGAGGWFIGGQFTSVGGVERSGLAHINADFSVDAAWDPVVTDPQWNTVRDLTLVNGTLYIGGGFTTIDGVTRNRLAAVDAATGELTSWNPNANNEVYALTSDDSAIYVGGNFSNVGGQTRNRLAAFSPIDGSLMAWNPNANNSVSALLVDGDVIYAGGGFSAVSGTSRNRIAAIATVATGDDTPTAFNPNVNSDVYAFTLDDTQLYAGGQFTSVNGGSVARNRVASFDTTTGSATAWNPNAGDFVRALEVTPQGVYIGGFFSNLGGVSRPQLGLVDATTGALQAFDARLIPSNGYLYDIQEVGSAGILAAGPITHVNVVNRTGGAAFDSNGLLTAWDPQLNGIGYTVDVEGQTAYVTGSFTSVGGVSRTRAASVDLVTGSLGPWAPTLSANAEDVEIVDNVAYLVGEFMTINGITRQKAGAVRIDDTGSLTDWSPSFNLGVKDLAISGNAAYVGGAFTTVNGVNRRYAAAMRIDDTGTVLPWDPNPNGHVYAVTADVESAYLGGEFTAVRSVTRRSAARVMLDDSATVMAWNPNVTCPSCFNDNKYPNVKEITVEGDAAYLAGYFDTVGTDTEFDSIAVVSSSGSGVVDQTWKPTLSLSLPTVNAVNIVGTEARIGGFFSYVGLGGTVPTSTYGTLPRVLTAPSAPSGTSATPSDASASVAWTVTSDGGSPITRVEFALDDTSVVDASTTSTSSPYLLTGLNNGQTYTVFVRLVNAIGTSSWSVASAAFTPQSAPPQPPQTASAPSQVTVSAGDSSAQVGWGAPASSGSYPVTNYQVSTAPSTAGCLTPSMECELTGLTNEVEYTVRVRALTGAGWGSWSEAVLVTPVAPAPPPPAPSILINGTRTDNVVRVLGVTTGIAGDQVTPWVRFPGQAAYEQGSGVRTIRSDGSFVWDRETRKKTYVYFRVPDGIRSNRVIIPARTQQR